MYFYCIFRSFIDLKLLSKVEAGFILPLDLTLIEVMHLYRNRCFKPILNIERECYKISFRSIQGE